MGWILAYLASVGISIGGFELVNKAYYNYIEREGYTSKYLQRSNSEKVLAFLANNIVFCLPVLNLILIAIMIFTQEKLMQDTFNQQKYEGIVYIPEKEEELQEEEFETQEERLETATNQIKKYQDMTISEKLEYLRRERDRIDTEYDKLMTESFEKKLK